MDKTIRANVPKLIETIIGPSVKIQGDLNGDGDIRIEGQITGRVNSNQAVFVKKNAQLLADIEASEASISGEVQGILRISRRLTLQPTARVSGEIICPVLCVEEGAIFSGKCSVSGEMK